MPGLLHINVTNADENYWAPHDQSCPPLTMMQAIRTASSAEAAITEELRFLSNKTVVLIGDSVRLWYYLLLPWVLMLFID